VFPGHPLVGIESPQKSPLKSGRKVVSTKK